MTYCIEQEVAKMKKRFAFIIILIFGIAISAVSVNAENIVPIFRFSEDQCQFQASGGYERIFLHEGQSQEEKAIKTGNHVLRCYNLASVSLNPTWYIPELNQVYFSTQMEQIISYEPGYEILSINKSQLFADITKNIAIDNLPDQSILVSEPASMFLLGSGLIGLASVRRRKNGNSSGICGQ